MPSKLTLKQRQALGKGDLASIRARMEAIRHKRDRASCREYGQLMRLERQQLGLTDGLRCSQAEFDQYMRRRNEEDAKHRVNSRAIALPRERGVYSAGGPVRVVERVEPTYVERDGSARRQAWQADRDKSERLQREQDHHQFMKELEKE